MSSPGPKTKDSKLNKYYSSGAEESVALTEVQDWVKDFCAARGWDPYHSPKELAIGLATEAGELLHHFRFKSDDEIQCLMNEDEKRQEIEMELADCFYFVLRFAQMNNIDLPKALAKKLEVNAQKYPVGSR